MLLFFAQDGPEYERKMMNGQVRQKNNIAIAEKK